jgi:uncharacterized protein (DUF433 family)
MLNLKTPTIIRTERGLTIKGTRVTLYDILAHLEQNWSEEKVREWFGLKKEEMEDVLLFIADNREELEAEFAQILTNAENNRAFWEAIKKQKAGKLVEKSEKKALYEKLKARQIELGIK